MKDGTKDAVVAFGVLMGMLTVYQMIEGQKAKTEGKALEAKIDKIVKKLGA